MKALGFKYGLLLVSIFMTFNILSAVLFQEKTKSDPENSTTQTVQSSPAQSKLVLKLKGSSPCLFFNISTFLSLRKISETQFKTSLPYDHCPCQGGW